MAGQALETGNMQRGDRQKGLGAGTGSRKAHGATVPVVGLGGSAGSRGLSPDYGMGENNDQ